VPEAAEFDAVAAQLGGDARWAALPGDEERRRALGRHGARLRAEAAFARLLDETPGLAADTPWPLVKRKARAARARTGGRPGALTVAALVTGRCLCPECVSRSTRLQRHTPAPRGRACVCGMVVGSPRACRRAPAG